MEVPKCPRRSNRGFPARTGPALRVPDVLASRRLKQISVLSETGEGKVFEEWVGEASVFGFEILPQPSERLCTQKPGGSIAC